MSDGMKIIKLDITDVGGVKAFELDPDGSHVVIGGKNAAGKTSVLDAIAGALGGAKNRKAQSVRRGAEHGSVVVDLGDLVVRWRAKEDGRDSLVVETADGAVVKSPVARLQRLFGERTVDPLAFFSAQPREQARMLADLAGVDLVGMDTRRRELYTERTAVNRLERESRAQIAAMERELPEGLPEHPVSTAELENWLADAVSLEQRREALETTVRDLDTDITKSEEQRDRELQRTEERLDAAITDQRATVRELEQRLAEATGRLEDMVAGRSSAISVATAEQSERHDALVERHLRATDELQRVTATLSATDADALRADLEEARATNAAIERRAALDPQRAACENHAAKAAKLTSQIEQIDAEKTAALAEAPIPVDGLGFADGAVTYRDLPLENLSGAERLRVSVALAIAASPGIRVMLIDRWGDLDDDSRATVREMADEHGFQIWTTVVGTKDEDITVTIVDGVRS